MNLITNKQNVWFAINLKIVRNKFWKQTPEMCLALMINYDFLQ
jgi:hypothetical protein